MTDQPATDTKNGLRQNLDALIRERDALNERIDQVRHAVVDDFNTRLELLVEHVEKFAEQHGHAERGHRKRVESITINDTVVISYAEAEPGGSEGYLSVQDKQTGMDCEFNQGLPCPDALIGLIAGQLGFQTWTAS